MRTDNFASEYENCTVCPRRCGADRLAGVTGFCGMGADPVVNLSMLHFGEEPPITGTRGSGTVFFEGCSLKCIFCQNYDVSRGPTGYGTAMTPGAGAAEGTVCGTEGGDASSTAADGVGFASRPPGGAACAPRLPPLARKGRPAATSSAI